MNENELQAWLANTDGFGATDEEFAEFIVSTYRMWKRGHTRTREQGCVDDRLTSDDMNHFPVENFCNHLKDVLNEIIYSDEIDASAWWKQEQGKIPEENLKLFRKESNHETAFGEPALWLDLPRERSLEITLESEGLTEEEWYYSVRIHCSSDEFDRNSYQQTLGVIEESVWRLYDRERMVDWANDVLCLLQANKPEEKSTAPSEEHEASQILTAPYAAGLIDRLEDWLDEKKVVIPNEDREREALSWGGEPASEVTIGEFAQIYGDDFDRICHEVEDMLEAALKEAGVPEQRIAKDKWENERSTR